MMLWPKKNIRILAVKYIWTKFDWMDSLLFEWDFIFRIIHTCILVCTVCKKTLKEVVCKRRDVKLSDRTVRKCAWVSGGLPPSVIRRCSHRKACNAGVFYSLLCIRLVTINKNRKHCLQVVTPCIKTMFGW